MKNNLNTIIQLMTVLIIVCSFNAAWAGGDAGNGGGGDVKKDDKFIPVGDIGRMLAHSKALSYMEKLDGFQKRNPDVRMVKCNEGLAYPLLPQELKDKVAINIFIDKNPVEKFFGAKPEIEPLSHDLLCDNKARVSAYGHLVMELVVMARKDVVGAHLLNKIAEKGTATFLISDERKVIKAKGGEIEEFSWFDHDTGRIFWSNRDEPQGVALLIGRQYLSYLRHELTHLLIYRSLKHYPKVEYWHDVSEDTRKDKYHSNSPTYDRPVQQFYDQFKTSPEAAFIEGLAFALEKGTSLDCSFVLRRGNFNCLLLNRLSNRDEDGEGSEYNYWDSRGIVLRDGKLVAPIESEVYLASTLDLLLNGFESIDPKKIEEETSHEIWVFQESDRQMMMSVVDTISKYGPSNVVEFAKALDDYMKGDIGYRWLREFFFYDYKTEKNIIDEFSSFKAEDFFVTESGQKRPRLSKLIVSKKKQNLFFTPYKEDQEKLAVLKSQEVYAGTYSEEKIIQKIDEIIQKMNDFFKRVETKVMPIKEAIQKKKEEPLRFKSFEEKEKLRLIVNEIYDRAIREYGVNAEEGLIKRFIEEGGQAYLEKALQAYQNMFEKLKTIKEVVIPREGGHRERVVRLLKCRNDLVKKADALAALVVYTKIISELATKEGEHGG